MKDAKNNQTTATELAEQTTVEREVKETNVELENKDLAGETVETKSVEDNEVAEETEEKETKEVCPKCGKEPCECVADNEEKNCGEEPKQEEKKLEPTVEELRTALIKQLETDAVEIRSLGELVKDTEAAERFVAEHKTLN